VLGPYTDLSTELSLMLEFLVLCPSWVQDTAEQSAQHIHSRSMGLWLLQSSTEVHEVIHAEEIGQVPGITPVAAGSRQSLEVTFAGEVGGDPTVVLEVEVELMTCPPMKCRLGGTSEEHPPYYHLKVLTSPSFSSLLPLQKELGMYHLVQSWHSQER
jgi:hypothetical protein